METTLTPYHDPDDAEKVQSIAASMSVSGWVGAPLVAWDDNLITGSHRYAAAQLTGTEIETISIEDVFVEDGKDFATCHAEHGYPTIDDYITGFVHELSEATRQAYGIDIH